MTTRQLSRIGCLTLFVFACVSANAQYVYPPPFNFSGEPYQTQAVAPNFFLYTPNYGATNTSGFRISIPSGGLNAVPGSPFAAAAGDPAYLAVDPTGRCAVEVLYGTTTIEVYSIDPNSGSLTPYGLPITVGPSPWVVAIDPSGRFVYVSDNSTGAIYGFTLEPGDCQLDAIAGSPFSGATTPEQAVVDPSGRWLYVALATGSYPNPGFIEGYSINSATGALTPLTGSPWAAGNYALGLAITPSDQFLYTTNYYDNTLSGFSINQSTGALTTLATSPFTTGAEPYGLAIHPSGAWLYVANYSDTTVSGFAINPTSGALTALTGSPFTPAGGSGPLYPGIDPGGNFLFTANYNSSDISTFNINPINGVLTNNIVSGTTVPTGTNPYGIVTVAPLSNQNNLVFSYLFQ